MKEIFGIDCQFKEVILAGHSFGGTTNLATKAKINEMENKKYKNMIQKLIVYDPWYFPF